MVRVEREGGWVVRVHVHAILSTVGVVTIAAPVLRLSKSVGKL